MTNPVAPVVTDEMVQAALKIACNQRPVGCGDGDTYTVSVPTFSSMRAAITAALEASGELERLRAANEKMKSALAYYADDGAKPNPDGPWKQNSIDFGDLARCTLADVANLEAALAKMEESK